MRTAAAGPDDAVRRRLEEQFRPIGACTRGRRTCRRRPASIPPSRATRLRRYVTPAAQTSCDPIGARRAVGGPAGSPVPNSPARWATGSSWVSTSSSPPAMRRYSLSRPTTQPLAVRDSSYLISYLSHVSCHTSVRGDVGRTWEATMSGRGQHLRVPGRELIRHPATVGDPDPCPDPTNLLRKGRVPRHADQADRAHLGERPCPKPTRQAIRNLFS